MFRNHDLVEELEVYRPIGDRVVLISFDPWAVHTGKWQPMLRRILAEGFRIIAFDRSRLVEEQIEQVYRKNHPIHETSAWHLPRHVYTLGVTFTLLLMTEPGDTPAPVRMKALKGVSSPLIHHAGQLRHDFRAPNKSLSLMHSSDDWDSTAHEALVFFSPDELHHALSDPHAERSDAYAHALLTEDTHENLEAVREIAPTQLIQKLRLRLLELLAAMGTTPDTTARILDAWRQSAQPSPEGQEDVPAEAARFVALMSAQRADLEALKLVCPPTIAQPRRYVRHRDPVALFNLLEALSLPEAYATVDVEHLLAAARFPLDRWEDLLLRTTLFHFSEVQRVNA